MTGAPPFLSNLVCAINMLVVVPVAVNANVPRYGLYEESLSHTGQYKTPYTDLEATADLIQPDGNIKRSVPLFWDGDQTWKFRFSPDTIGSWQWRVTSSDPGLNGMSGHFEVVESSGQGGIRPRAASPYHFERQDGSPFWFLGDTAWALCTDHQGERHDREAATQYIDVRAAQGFNVLHSMLLSEAGWPNAGGPPFHDLASERINPGYWQEVDRRIAYANSRGIVAGLALAWGDKRGVEPYAWRKFPDLPARERFARYIAARYSAFDTYFVVSGEWHAEIRTRKDATEESVKQEFVQLGDVVRRSDPHGRMIAIHPMTRHGSVREFVGTSWMAFGDYQQNYEQLHERALQSRRFEKPVVNSEYGYFLRDSNGDGLVDKDNSTDATDLRHATWDVVMAGCYVVTGFGTTYFGGHRDPGPFDVGAEKNDVWEEQIQHLPRLFTSLAWWKLSPADEAITAQVPRSGDRQRRIARAGGSVTVRQPPKVAYWLLADPGQTNVAYVRGSRGPFEIKLSDAGSFKRLQFDPRTGRTRPLGQQTAQDSLTYQPPDEQDWVLLIQRVR